MSDTLTELATFITTNLSVTTPVRKGSMPPNPNSVVAIYEYGGLTPDHVFGQSAIEIEHPRVQIAVRGEPAQYAEPRAVAETIYRGMSAASAQSIASTRYLTMEPIQPPFLITRDDNNRAIIGFNVQLSKALSA